MWRLKEDFYSLFQQQKYAPIDGMRSISCLMIICLHIGNLLSSFTPPYPHWQWMIYLESFSFRLSSLWSLSLETFFMLSGFLLTQKLIQQQCFFSWKEYPMYILKRACRFWPGILLTTLVMLILGEPEGNWTSPWLFYQNYVSMEKWSVGFAALWSVSLDMQMHLLLPLILQVIVNSKSNHQRTYFALYVLVILSIVYALVIFDPNTMNIPALMYRHNPLALLMPARILDWIKTEYNVTLAFEKPISPSPMKPFMELMYLSIPSRYSSFLVGSILAFHLNHVQNTSIIHHGKMKKYIYFTFILLFMLLLATPAGPETVHPVVLTIMVSISRQLFSISQAFILFSTICPPTHPYYSPWMKWFLSLPIWTPIAKLSYLIYVLHFRIALELIMTYSHLFDPKQSSIDSLTLICLGIIFTICLMLSTVWFILVEKPFERLINMQLSTRQKFHTK